MKRVLVVQQYKGKGSGQDQQRGRMYEEVFRANGYEPRYIGRKLPFAPSLSRRTGRWARTVRRSLPYKGIYWLLECASRSLTDLRIQHAARKHDIVIFIKTDSARLIAGVRKASRASLVYDFADALWLPQHGIPSEDLRTILTSVDSVTCDNEYCASFVKAINPSVHLWPSASHIEFFDALPDDEKQRDPTRIVIGWIGSHGTARSLEPILEVLREISRSRPDVHVRLVGFPPEAEWQSKLVGMRATTLPLYDRDDMIREVSRMDIGLFPMFDDEDAKARGVTKALIYMAGGAVVAASAVAGAVTLIRDGVDGVLVGPGEWESRLRALIGNPDRRRAIAARAQERMRSEYTLERCFEALQDAFDAPAIRIVEPTRPLEMSA